MSPWPAVVSCSAQPAQQCNGIRYRLLQAGQVADLQLLHAQSGGVCALAVPYALQGHGVYAAGCLVGGQLDGVQLHVVAACVRQSEAVLCAATMIVFALFAAAVNYIQHSARVIS